MFIAAPSTEFRDPSDKKNSGSERRCLIKPESKVINGINVFELKTKDHVQCNWCVIVKWSYFVGILLFSRFAPWLHLRLSKFRSVWGTLCAIIIRFKHQTTSTIRAFTFQRVCASLIVFDFTFFAFVHSFIFNKFHNCLFSVRFCPCSIHTRLTPLVAKIILYIENRLKSISVTESVLRFFMRLTPPPLFLLP